MKGDWRNRDKWADIIFVLGVLAILLVVGVAVAAPYSVPAMPVHEEREDGC